MSHFFVKSMSNVRNEGGVSSEIKIERDSNTVWMYFTNIENWKKWFDVDLVEVIPGWESGAKLKTAQGKQWRRIENIIPRESITLDSSLTTPYMLFQFHSSFGGTVVEMGVYPDMDLRDSWDDKKRQVFEQICKTKLEKLKEFVEKETTAKPEQSHPEPKPPQPNPQPPLPPEPSPLDKLKAATQKYLNIGYHITQQSDRFVIAECRSSPNIFLLITSLVIFSPSFIVYLILGTRKKYWVKLELNANGEVQETGDTIEVFERNKDKITKAGWIVVAVDVLLYIVACIIFIFIALLQK